MNTNIPTTLRSVLEALPTSYLVGGCVRDMLLGHAPKDYDVEVFDMGYEELQAKLTPFGKVDLVGKSFGVIKLTVGADVYDVAIPRREHQVGPGHKGFTVTTDGLLSLREAARRRDFTVNALFLDPRSGKILDFYNGKEDLRNGIIRHTSEAFSEDPLRVLRAMQFAGRFGFRVAPVTIELCKTIHHRFQELPPARIWDEWYKWASKSVKPSLGLEFLRDCGWLTHFPQLSKLVGVRQDPAFHPEGDAFLHTSLCCDALANDTEWIESRPERRALLMLATLLHDVGKSVATTTINGKTISHGHEDAGVLIAQQYLALIQVPNSYRDMIIPLVANHMARLQTPSANSVRRLAVKIHPATLDDLTTVMRADANGHGPSAHKADYLNDIQALACELEIKNVAPKPIVSGYHLTDILAIN